jgi:hypothetical protein
MPKVWTERQRGMSSACVGAGRSASPRSRAQNDLATATSTPEGRAKPGYTRPRNADVAQQVEHLSRKEDVAGSSPAVGLALWSGFLAPRLPPRQRARTNAYIRAQAPLACLRDGLNRRHALGGVELLECVRVRT